MKKISLFIAMSLDGYIADSNDSINWLVGQDNDDNNIDVYSEFVKNIDTVIMGWNTYHQIITELSPDEWVYNDFTTYVVTHSPKSLSDKIHFTDESPVDLVKKIRKENGKDTATPIPLHGHRNLENIYALRYDPNGYAWQQP